jgi:hypothetical protein
MLRHLLAESGAESCQFRIQPFQFARKACQHTLEMRIGPAGERGEHRSATLARDMAGDRRQFEVHGFQQTAHTADQPVAILLHMHPHASQFAQLPDQSGPSSCPAKREPRLDSPV